VASFVHVSDARKSNLLLRNGIRATRLASGGRGVYCTPVVPDFHATFQWARELKRAGYRTACAIQFRVADDEMVTVGRYGTMHLRTTAAEAVALFMSDSAAGWEVIIPRSISPREITRVRSVPQVTGWRYYPEAKGQLPRWPTRGDVKAKRTRTAIERWNRSPYE
jgi:hypothetical protein